MALLAGIYETVERRREERRKVKEERREDVTYYRVFLHVRH